MRVRSYVVEEQHGRIGAFCIYETRDGESIHRHARRVDTPEKGSYGVATIVVRTNQSKARLLRHADCGAGPASPAGMESRRQAGATGRSLSPRRGTTYH
jgi:hypothetical protein